MRQNFWELLWNVKGITKGRDRIGRRGLGLVQESQGPGVRIEKGGKHDNISFKRWH